MSGEPRTSKNRVNMSPTACLTPNVTDSQIGVAAMLQIITAIVGGIIPGLVGDIVKNTTSTAGYNVAPAGASTNIGTIIIGAIMAGLGASGFGVDAMHTISAVAGVLVIILAAVNHMGVIGASNANTEALVEQFLTQLANYQPPVAGSDKTFTYTAPSVPASTDGSLDVAKAV